MTTTTTEVPTSDDVIRKALERVHSPITVTFSERWLLNILSDSLEAELRRAAGTLKRSRGTFSKTSAQARIDSIQKALDEVNAARKEA